MALNFTVEEGEDLITWTPVAGPGVSQALTLFEGERFYRFAHGSEREAGYPSPLFFPLSKASRDPRAADSFAYRLGATEHPVSALAESKGQALK